MSIVPEMQTIMAVAVNTPVAPPVIPIVSQLDYSDITADRQLLSNIVTDSLSIETEVDAIRPSFRDSVLAADVNDVINSQNLTRSTVTNVNDEGVLPEIARPVQQTAVSDALFRLVEQPAEESNPFESTERIADNEDVILRREGATGFGVCEFIDTSLDSRQRARNWTMTNGDPNGSVDNIHAIGLSPNFTSDDDRHWSTPGTAVNSGNFDLRVDLKLRTECRALVTFTCPPIIANLPFASDGHAEFCILDNSDDSSLRTIEGMTEAQANVIGAKRFHVDGMQTTKIALNMPIKLSAGKHAIRVAVRFGTEFRGLHDWGPDFFTFINEAINYQSGYTGATMRLQAVVLPSSTPAPSAPLPVSTIVTVTVGNLVRSLPPDWQQPEYYIGQNYSGKTLITNWCTPTAFASQYGALATTGLVNATKQRTPYDMDHCLDDPHIRAAPSMHWSSATYTADFGWWMNTNNAGSATLRTNSRISGTPTVWALKGMEQFYASMGRHPTGWAMHKRNAFGNAPIGSFPTSWVQSSNMYDSKTVLSGITQQILGNRSVVLFLDSWNVQADATTQPVSLSGNKVGFFSIGSRTTSSEHLNENYVYEEDAANTIGHTVLCVGVIPRHAGYDWLIVQDNDPTTPRFVALPFTSAASGKRSMWDALVASAYVYAV